jgi:hypothetical protein
VHDQGHPLQSQRLDEAVDIPDMVNESILEVGLVGLSHADEIDRDAPRVGLEVRHDVAPEIRRRGVPVQEQDRVAGARLHVVQAGTEHVDKPRGVGHVGGNRVVVHGRAHRCLLRGVAIVSDLFDPPL